MRLIQATARLASVRRRASVLGVFLLASYVPFAQPTPAGAAAFSGGFSPTIVSGKADLNGDGAVTGRDDADAFYGDTHIIDGQLDCDAWGPIANAGTAGDGAIGAADDCSLVGYDGTPDGVTIDVVNGAFQVADGPLPTVFNAGHPSNPDVGASDFAWSTIDGRRRARRRDGRGRHPREPGRERMWVRDGSEHGRQRSRGPERRFGYHVR